MNWGKGITIFLVMFIAFITTLAVILMKTSADLVSDDYYKREVMYGDEVTAEQNALDAKAELVTEQNEAGLFIQIKQNELPTKVNIHLLRGNNPNDDIRLTSDGPSVFIEHDQLTEGKYLLTCSYEVNGKPFQLKKSIWIAH
jgi:hypothetical protein